MYCNMIVIYVLQKTKSLPFYTDCHVHNIHKKREDRHFTSFAVDVMKKLVKHTFNLLYYLYYAFIIYFL